MTIPRNLTLLLVLAATLFPQASVALPPPGLTSIAGEHSSGLRPKIGVVDGVAYVTSQEGIYPIDENGVGELILPVNPFGGTVERLHFTRVSKSTTGAAHVAVGFAEDLFTPLGVATYNLANPSKPVNTWPELFGALGLTAEGAIFGGGKVLHPGGSVTTYPDPPAEEVDFQAIDATPSGLIIGYSTIPGTAGARDVLISIDGGHERLGPASFDGTIRDRNDGAGVNIGRRSIRYGAGPFIEVLAPPGMSTGKVLVSETDFAIIEPDGNFVVSSIFYPGISPAADNRAVALLDFFPDLIPLEEAEGRLDVVDVASSEGQIHILLSSPNGLWLYAAPDPSLGNIIPEPTCGVLAMLAAVALLGRRRR